VKLTAWMRDGTDVQLERESEILIRDGRRMQSSSLFELRRVAENASELVCWRAKGS
jgi:hypothetical protein